MILEPDTSYAVVPNKSEDWLNVKVLNYIKHINREVGIKEGKSLLGKCFIIDDKEKPTKDVVVISRCKRIDKDFKIVDLEKEPLHFLCEMLKIEDETVRAYILKYCSKKSLSIVENYLLFYRGHNDFERLKIALKNKVYEDSIYYKDKIAKVIRFVSTKNPDSLVEFKKMYESYIEGGGDFNSFVYLVYGILDRDVPDYVKDEVRVYISKEYHKRKSALLIELAKVEDIEDLIKSVLKLQ